MPKKRFYDEAMSKRDGGMIKGGGHAGMPQNVIMKYYPKDGGYMPENLNDGLSGIDSQIKSDKGGVKKQKPDSKY